MTQIQVVRFNQAGFTLYSGTMTVGQLMDYAIIDEWNPTVGWDMDLQGYQRAPISDHYRRIATFLKEQGAPLLPTNALLASRDREYGRLQFTSVDGELGHLDIPEDRYLYIIDYQHRWRGFKYAVEDLGQTALRNTTIPVTILSDTPRFDEMKQFYLINNKQKRVNTDLALTLMQAMSTSATEDELVNLVGSGNKYQIRATRIVVQIAQMSSGPWAGKIQEPNVPANPNQTATIKSFVESLRPIVSTRSPVYSLSDDELIKLIDMIWTGVLDLWSEWKNNPGQFAIQRNIGLYVIHRVARLLLIPTMLASGIFSAATVTTALSRSSGTLMAMDFWRTGGIGRVNAFSSGAGHSELALMISRT